MSATMIYVLLISSLVMAALLSPPMVRWRQRSMRGYADEDVTRVHQKMMEARDEQKPFHMTRFELNALRATTNDFHEETGHADQ